MAQLSLAADDFSADYEDDAFVLADPRGLERSWRPHQVRQARCDRQGCKRRGRQAPWKSTRGSRRSVDLWLPPLTDKDGGATGVSWKWYRGGPSLMAETSPQTLETLDDAAVCDADADTPVNPSATGACEIGGAAGSALYTPGADDVGWLLHAVATYTDMIENPDRDNTGGVDLTELAGVSSEFAAQESDPANTAPVFPDQDLNAAGDQSDMAMRSVAENANGANVGEPVSAGDADGDALMFSLSGDDADMFTVTNNGQIKTAVELDYEALPEDAKYHMVTLMAQDPSTAYDRIMVQINVTDADDPCGDHAGTSRTSRTSRERRSGLRG